MERERKRPRGTLVRPIMTDEAVDLSMGCAVLDLAAARRGAGLSQYELDDLAGLVRGTTCRWECGRVRPSLYGFVRCARALGLALTFKSLGIPDG